MNHFSIHPVEYFPQEDNRLSIFDIAIQKLNDFRNRNKSKELTYADVYSGTLVPFE